MLVKQSLSFFPSHLQCLEKFPVIQHFKFGSLLSIQPTKPWRSCHAHNGTTKFPTVFPSSGILTCKYKSSKNQPHVVWHMHSHMYTHVVIKACRPSITLMRSILWMSFGFWVSLYFCHCIYIMDIVWISSFLRDWETFFRSVLIEV